LYVIKPSTQDEVIEISLYSEWKGFDHVDIPKFHVITTDKQPIEELQKVLTAIAPFTGAVHIREKEKTAKQIQCLLESLPFCRSKIIVNDRVDVAHALKAKGVQLAYHSLDVSVVIDAFPSLIVGKSVHSVEEALEAEKDGAHYILYGHIYSTHSKKGLKSRGVAALKEVVDAVQIPVIAIGGITPVNAKEVLQTGAHGIAVMSGVMLAQDPLKAIKQYSHIWTSGGGENEAAL
jgi:thiazole tautomerase (transcriptional regulator TenI)